jgi:hypothetical protein
MGRQKSFVKLAGEIGDISFFESKGGFHEAREKKGIPGSRIKTDPAFERTRENGEEFGRAGNAGKILRNAFRSLIYQKADRYMVGRLTQMMVRVLHADTVSVRGKRNVLDGELELLRGFEFNMAGPLAQVFLAPYTSVIDRDAGTLTMTVPPFDPKAMTFPPEGATHFKLNVGGSEIDFEAGSYQTSIGSSDPIGLDVRQQPQVTLVANVTPASTRPLFLLVGIEFMQMVNGISYPLKTGVVNAVSLVGVDGGV